MNIKKQISLICTFFFVVFFGCSNINKVNAGDVVGLTNVGNSCYLNSTIQMLYSDKRFVRAIGYCRECFEQEEAPKNTVIRLAEIFDGMSSLDNGGCLNGGTFEDNIKNLGPGLYLSQGGSADNAVRNIIGRCEFEIESIKEFVPETFLDAIYNNKIFTVGRSDIEEINKFNKGKEFRDVVYVAFCTKLGSELNLASDGTYTFGGKKYKIKAISGGPKTHAVSYVRAGNVNSYKWYEIDDSRVQEISYNNMMKKIKSEYLSLIEFELI